MKPYEIKLIAKLLEIAAKELGHSLVECDLTEAGLTAEEAYQINLAYAKWAGREGDWEEDELQTYAIGGESGLLYYFADRLRKASEEIDDASQNKRRSAPEHPPATPEHLRTNTQTRWG